jgi:hypothetical protein
MSTNPPQPPKIDADRQTAWACLGTNLLVLPGLGSVIAGRRVGYAQMVLAACGLASSLIFVGVFLNVWLEGQDIWPGWGAMVAGLGGMGLFGVSWLWGLWTSVALLRKAR